MGSKPWHMQPGESAKAYQAFQAYVDMGAERSLERLGQMLDKSRTHLGVWSARFDWQARVRAFDEAATAKASDRALEDAAAVRARQAQHARAIQLRAMPKIASMDPGDMSMSEATRAWQVGAEAERKALGIADALDLTTGGGPIIPIIIGPADAEDDIE